MVDNFTFELLGVQEHMAALKVTARSPLANVVTEIQAEDSVMRELQDTITEFLSESDLETYWESDIPGLGASPCITLRLLPGSSEEAVLAEVYLELDDGSDFSRHTCCFYVRTDREQLMRFGSGIAELFTAAPGTILALNP